MTENTTISYTDYLGERVDRDRAEVDYLLHDLGRVVAADAGKWIYEYHLTDHLGNVRVAFADLDEDGDAEMLQENHYYPFGQRLNLPGYQSSDANPYLYNGKELQEDLGLRWYDYGARFYDQALGRWHVLDPLAEEYYSYSQYLYCRNNPIFRIDPNGKSDKVVLTGNEADKAVEQIQSATSMKITRNAEGELSAEGEAKTKNDKRLLAAINDESITVNVEANDSKNIEYEGIKYTTNGGAFMGNAVTNKSVSREFQSGIKPYEVTNISYDIITVNAYQIVNPNMLEDFDTFAGTPGHAMLHEVTESYSGALKSKETGISALPATTENPTSGIYNYAHRAKTTTPQPGDGVITQSDLKRIRILKELNK